MQNKDNIISQIRLAIKKSEILMAKHNPATEEGSSFIEYHRRHIAELEYRIKELEGEVLQPAYDDGKYASSTDKAALDMLRVFYYERFKKEPNISRKVVCGPMFRDPTLNILVNKYSIIDEYPFVIMFSDDYPEHTSDDKLSISIEVPYGVLPEEENEDHLRFLLGLIKLYSGETVNLVLSDWDYRTILSYIGISDLRPYSIRDQAYIDFFDRLCDNMTRNIIHVGESMQVGVSQEALELVQRKYIDIHAMTIVKRGNLGISMEELKDRNQKIKSRILNISSKL